MAIFAFGMKSDLFRFKQFEMRNSVSGLKIGTDGVLLGAWADVAKCAHAWDVGSGTGLVALMVAQRSDCQLTAIEIDHAAALESKQNAAASPWAKRIKVIEGDINLVANSLDRPDVILCNPPYYAAGKSLEAGNNRRDVARRDGSLSFESIISIASEYLTADGDLFIISPADRKGDIEWLCALRHLYVRHCTSVFTKRDLMSSRLLWRISRQDGPLVSDSIAIRNESGTYTDEFKKLTEDYYIR